MSEGRWTLSDSAGPIVRGYWPKNEKLEIRVSQHAPIFPVVMFSRGLIFSERELISIQDNKLNWN